MNALTPKKQAIQERVLKNGTAYHCYRFARYVKGADIKSLQNRVLKIGDGWDCYHFARDVQGADIKALRQRIAELSNQRWLEQFDQELPMDTDAGSVQPKA